MSEPVQPTQSGPPAPPPSGASPSGSPPSGLPPSAAISSGSPASRRPGEVGVAEESLRRKLLMGAALLLALASIYAGVFNVGRVAQIVLAAGATMAVVLALTSGSRRRNS